MLMEARKVGHCQKQSTHLIILIVVALDTKLKRYANAFVLAKQKVIPLLIKKVYYSFASPMKFGNKLASNSHKTIKILL